MPARPLRLTLVVAAAVLLAGGCKKTPAEEAGQSAKPQQEAARAAASGQAATGAAAAAAGGAGAAGQSEGGAGEAAHPAGAAAVDKDAARRARRDAALAAARPMRVNAATGGVYRSADGKVQVTLPPGALASDAVVRFWTIDTAGLPLGPLGPVGLVIDGDLGGATFEPGALVTFKAPVDDRFIEAITRAGVDPTSLGVSRDNQGRRYLEVTMTVDETGRPDSSSLTPVGGGQLVEVARLPVNLERVAYKKVEKRAVDPPPEVPAGVKTLEPLPALDPLVMRYPGAPADQYHTAEMTPVRYLKQGDRRIRIRESLPATMAGDPAMVTCTFNPCDGDPIKPLEDAIHLNDAISAQRLPPAGLRTRTKHPDLGCPPDREPTPRPDVGVQRLGSSAAPE